MARLAIFAVRKTLAVLNHLLDAKAKRIQPDKAMCVTMVIINRAIFKCHQIGIIQRIW